MTITTDELRRKLAELHVEYKTIDATDICFTEWSTHNGAFVFTARESIRSYGDNRLRVETCGITKSCMIATPEQAIVATLGAGTKANAENVKLRQLVAAYASALMRMCDQTQALYPCDKCVLGKGYSSDRCGIDELKEETHKLRVEADALD